MERLRGFLNDRNSIKVKRFDAYVGGVDNICCKEDGYVTIGTLKEVDIRDLWKHEQYDFSNWLAEKENISYLNDILGLTLIDVNKEAYVGSYRCDLVAVDETDGTKVIIENQLKTSNHDHLGKIITYASGLDAQVVVWIVKQAREEHRSAIEWLNNSTNSHINFFLVEIHAYKIGDSDPAPKFEIIEQPNNFIKSAKNTSSGRSEMNKSQGERLAFWNMFNDKIIARGKPFKTRKATTDHGYDIAIDNSNCHLRITLVNSESYIGLELYINNNKDIYDYLYNYKDNIEKKMEFCFEWHRLDDKKASRILYKLDGLNFDDHSNYPALMEEIIDKILKMKEVFSKYLKEM